MERITEIVLDRPFQGPALMIIKIRRTWQCRLRVSLGAALLTAAAWVLGVGIDLEIETPDQSVLH